jgi:hypothetical protein
MGKRKRDAAARSQRPKNLPKTEAVLPKPELTSRKIEKARRKLTEVRDRIFKYAQ